jgi:hypothetical protein
MYRYLVVFPVNSHMIKCSAISQISCFVANANILVQCSHTSCWCVQCSEGYFAAVFLGGGGVDSLNIVALVCVCALDLTVPSFESWTIWEKWQEPGIHLRNVYKFCSYLTENILISHYRHQSFNDVMRKITLCIGCEGYEQHVKAHTHTNLVQCRVL